MDDAELRGLDTKSDTTSDVGSPKRERITLEVSPQVASEVEYLASELGVKKVELFRQSLGILKLIVDETRQGNKICIVNPGNPSLMRQIEIIPLRKLQ